MHAIIGILSIIPMSIKRSKLSGSIRGFEEPDIRVSEFDLLLPQYPFLQL